MSGFDELKLQPALAAALESCGYSAMDASLREQVPAALRGTNLVFAAPPAARYALPAMAGLVSGLLDDGSRALVLAPEHAIEEWGSVLLPLAAMAGLPALAASEPARATRRLRDGTLRLLVTTPASALALLQRSALKADQLGRVVLAWPEFFESDDALAALMQDLPSEAQRVLIPALPKPGHAMIERYARRALVTGPLASGDTPERKPAVRVALTGWGQRGATLAALLEAEDPESMVVWCIDRGSAPAAEAALPVGDATIRVCTTEEHRATLIVAWDLPSPSRLSALSSLGDLVLLVPPHASHYVREATSRQAFVRIRGATDQARDVALHRRAIIRSELERDDLDGNLLTLAPLFERHDPARVAAALYRLWLAKPEAVAPPAGGVVSSPEMGRVWVGVGRKDGAGPADIVGALTREVGVDAAKIGRIEVRELFCLVEVPAAEAEEIARGLSGKTIRRRQVTAKVDRGRPSDGSRGPSAPSPRGRPVRPKP